jgi:hypothetical protein
VRSTSCSRTLLHEISYKVTSRPRSVSRIVNTNFLHDCCSTFSLTDTKHPISYLSTQLSQYSVSLQTGRRGFDPQQRHISFCLTSVQTCSGAYPASCPMGTGGPFPGAKARPGVTLTTHPHQTYQLTKLTSSFCRMCCRLLRQFEKLFSLFRLKM